MEEKQGITKEQIEFAGILHDSLWMKLKDKLGPEQMRLVEVFDRLSTSIQALGSDGDGPMEEGQIIREFEYSLDETLDVLPEEDWPLAVYDFFPGRGTPEMKQAHIERLKTTILLALLELPIEERVKAISMVGSTV